MEGVAVSRVRAAVIVLAVLVAVYVGAYFALLDTTTRMSPYFGPKYKTDSLVARAVFAPLAWIDLQVRPGYWSTHFIVSQF
jgi:hypothetical protein